jgi:Superinfection immunity protein
VRIFVGVVLVIAGGMIVVGLIAGEPIIIIPSIILLYFVPTFVAHRRGHRNAGAIAVLNILLGWTLIGWVVALVWACTSPRD